MDDREVDKLLERALAGGAAPEPFRRQVLRDSTTALRTRPAAYSRWRVPALAAAAVLIATVSFLSGRASVPQRENTTVVGIPTDAQTVSVPNELIAWLEAARFFKQLGMEDRVAVAYERAGRLLPRDLPIAANPAAASYASESDASPQDSDERQPVRKTPVILAHSFGG